MNIPTKRKVPKKSILLIFSKNEPGGVGMLTYKAITITATKPIGTLI